MASDARNSGNGLGGGFTRLEDEAAPSGLAQAILDAATEFCVIATDLAGAITVVSKGAEQLLDYAASELMGKRAVDILHVEEELAARGRVLSGKLGRPVDGFEAVVGLATAEGSTRREWTYLRRDGSRIPVSLAVSPLAAASGERTGYLMVARDLSERKAAERSLRESEQRFRGAFLSSGIGMAIVGLDGSWKEVNAALLKILGYRESELLRLTFQDITHPEDLGKDLTLLEETVLGRRDTYSLEKRYLHAEGRVIWANLNVSLVRGEDGRPSHFVSQVVDVTREREYAQHLREVSERLSLAVRAGGIGIWDLDVASGRLVWDEQMYELYGIDPKRTRIGFEDWNQALHPEDRERAAREAREAMQDRGEFNTEFRIERPDGTVRHLRALALIQRNERGEVARMVGTNWDVTASVEQREALARLAEQAKAASRAKSQFLANMSHEIRTPMNGVIGMTSLLQGSEGLNASQRRQVEVIRSCGDALLALVNDILDFSKVEAGKLELEQVPFRLSELLEEFSSMLELRAREKALSFECQVEADVPNALVGDPARLRQVLLNLAGNALKFTHEGGVRVRVTLLEGELEAATLRFSVRDTGIGISSKAQAGLFEEFTQVEGPGARAAGGTGLGLAISRQLVELMGGEIGVASQLGAGSEFWFTARFGLGAERLESGSESRTGSDAGQPSERMAPGYFEGRGLRVLVAEDNEVNRLVVCGLLGKFGLQSDAVENGVEAIKALGDRDYDAVLMDLQMPEMDGLEACRRLRAGAAGACGRTVPIVALTAYARVEDRESCRRAGMDDYVSKPVAPLALFEILERLLSPQSTAGPSEKGTGEGAAVALAVFDRDRLVSGMLDDEALAREIATASLADFDNRLAELRDALASGDGRATGLCLHTLKGVAKHVHCQALGALMMELEEAFLRDGLDPVAGRLAEAERSVADAKAAVQAFVG